MLISVVSYLNSAPLVHGILHSGLMDDCLVSLDIPAAGAKKLALGEVDLALVPIGAFPAPGMVEWIGNYCIGVEGPVRTVCLFSEVPINQIKKVWLDPHSRTSVQLIQILARHHWKVTWQFHSAKDGFERRSIRGVEAGVCIGDKVFEIEGKYKYTYDLAEEWIRMTSLPFVFAAWASTKPIKEEVIQRLDLAQKFGIEAIPEIARDYSQKTGLAESDLIDYLSRNISYPFTPGKRIGMNRFLDYLNKKED
jgi:chorismate dehydratase